MSDLLHVTIDSREDDIVNLGSAFSEYDSIESWDVSMMDVGDIAVGDDVIIERKETSDYASSLLDGRLFKQAEMLSRDERTAFILIEGNLSDFNSLRHTRVLESSLMGSMASIMQRYQVPIIPCSDRERLVDLSVRLGRKVIETPSHNTEVEKEDKSLPTTVKLYSSIPSVGRQRAWNLYDYYDSVESLLSASIEDLKGIEGFGQTTAENVYQSLRK